MAVYMAMETSDGDIKGDVVDPKGYEGQIKLHSCSLGFHRAIIDGHLAGRMQGDGARFTCSFGAHAVQIWKALTDNSAVVGAVITFDSSDDGDNPIVQVELSDGWVSACNFGVHQSSTLDFTIQFRALSISHVPSGQMHQDTLAHEMA